MSIHDRGFKHMDPEKRKAICSHGGRVAHAKGVAHVWSSEEAKVAGRKGGLAGAARRRQDRLARIELLKQQADAVGHEAERKWA